MGVMQNVEINIPSQVWESGESLNFEDLIVKVSHILQILAFFSEYLRRLCVLRDITSFSAFSDTPNSYLSRKKIRSEKFCLSAKLERF